jgi:putative acyl-CoA dehydrogenase
VFEAMQCLGGSGYVEESVMPLLFRESPLNAIWEGSGNVICLDILRTLAREPRAAEALRAALAEATGRDARYDAALSGAEALLKAPAEGDARRLAERLALLLQTALALTEGPEPLAEALLTRLDAAHHTAGAGPVDPDGLLALL